MNWFEYESGNRSGVFVNVDARSPIKAQDCGKQANTRRTMAHSVLRTDQHFPVWSNEMNMDRDNNPDPLIFGPLDLDPWDMDPKPPYTFNAYEYAPSAFPDGASLYNADTIKNSPSLEDNLYLANWINDPDPSDPIQIPSPLDSAASSFSTFSEQQQLFPADSFGPINPISPPSSFEDHNHIRPRVSSDMKQPTWAAQLWDIPSTSLRSPSLIRPSVRHSPLSDGTIRQRVPIRRGSTSHQHQFQSSSAPSFTAPSMARAYSSRRSESVVSISADDRDGTVRRKKRSPTLEESSGFTSADKSSSSEPLTKSMLKPPKLAPSAWQLYFTDWIQKQQRLGTRKLNVAQAAKEAGQEYASLSPEEKEPYKRRSQAAKETREREHEAYMRTLTPDDIKRENAYRAAQRKAGKSRKGNIKDPNAPKKPLSAYFMFLQRIRADPKLVREIFGDETETTKQSVLAAAKWRSMTDAERQPFLAQAEQEKMEYEAARRLYEEGTTGYGTNINFSILQSPAFPIIKLELSSESEGEGGH